MKAIKISLAIAVIGLISFFIIDSMVIQKKPRITDDNVNQSEVIDRNIDTLQKITFLKHKDLKAAHQEIIFDINDYYDENRLGSTKSQNSQTRERLIKKLNSVYSDKFLKFSYSVFNKTEWNVSDISFIRSECIELKKFKYLDKKGGLFNSYSKIQQVLAKYDEINNFIASCKVSYSADSFNAAFPINVVKQKIARAALYKKNKLENSLVNNCTRIYSQLNQTNILLFNSHVKYLENKINNYSETYSEYNSHGEYAKDFYLKLKSEINVLDNNIYHVSFFDTKYDNLMNMLDADNSAAASYFIRKQKK